MKTGLSSRSSAPLGSWLGDDSALAPTGAGEAAVAQVLGRVHEPAFVVGVSDGLALTSLGQATLGGTGGAPLFGYAPACNPEALGDPAFARAHGLEFNYVAGAMAGGIASVELVQAMARAGMLGFYGAAGLPLEEVEAGLHRLGTSLFDRPWGTNLIHSPYEPKLEQAVVDLYLRRGVTLVSASAYLDLTLPLLRYRFAGIRRDASGRPFAPNRVIAKVSRTEVAEKFLRPPTQTWLRTLAESGALTADECALAAQLPVATALTVEADSGGHTDNRPALTLLPTMLALRDRLGAQTGAQIPVGAAGGIGTPHAAMAAFAMGAAYVVTGTINQACLEAGTSNEVRQMLAEAGAADVTMAPAADMFEMGVELQVLRRGTLFPMRARKLWDLYRGYPSLDAIPAKDREAVERTTFGRPLTEVWSATRAFWMDRDPAQADRAERDPKHKMALCFRWYLGQASRWANQGLAERKADYQVWCGPAIGAFNAWTAGTFLESWEQRRAVPVALNLLHGAAVLTRAAVLRAQGVVLQPAHVDVAPRPVAQLEEFAL